MLDVFQLLNYTLFQLEIFRIYLKDTIAIHQLTNSYRDSHNQNSYNLHFQSFTASSFLFQHDLSYFGYPK